MPEMVVIIIPVSNSKETNGAGAVTGMPERFIRKNFYSRPRSRETDVKKRKPQRGKTRITMGSADFSARGASEGDSGERNGGRSRSHGHRERQQEESVERVERNRSSFVVVRSFIPFLEHREESALFLFPLGIIGHGSVSALPVWPQNGFGSA